MLACLQRVLSAYSFYDKATGYCQSLNFIAALFLMVLPEEDSFWLLSSVVSEYLPLYYNQVRVLRYFLWHKRSSFRLHNSAGSTGS